jgi:Outer membrane lipoprotein-sorting protein
MLRKPSTQILVCILYLTNLFLASQVTAAPSAREIMERVDLLQRKAADKSLSVSRLSSCPFAIKDKKVLCTQDRRVKVLESVSIQLGNDKKDSQGVSIVLAPAKEKGIGMLTYSYDDERDTESWLYLSALGKVKRMVSGSDENQEPVAFFGSEFTTEDMESGKTNEYDYQILQEGKYGNTEVWVIEAIPKPVRLRKTNYSKLRIWVDKSKHAPLKLHGYDKRGKLYKRTVFKGYRQINDLWTAKEVTVFNLRSKRLSTLTTEKQAFNVDIDPEFLTQRSLTDFAFREQKLSALRTFLQ